MKILVALKQVPDTETKIKVAADGKSLDPADVKWITSPYDEYALEEAIRIKEAKGAEVVAVAVGDDKAKDILRNALALGADRAVLLKGVEAGDPLAVAKALAGDPPDARADQLDGRHQRQCEHHGPQQCVTELRAGLGIRGDAAGIVVGSAGDQSRSQEPEPLRDAELEVGDLLQHGRIISRPSAMRGDA